MRMNKILLTDRKSILDLIICADTYGHNNQVLMTWFSQVLGNKLTDEHIQNFVEDLGKTNGYNKEDENSAIEHLKNFQLKYIKP